MHMGTTGAAAIFVLQTAFSKENTNARELGVAAGAHLRDGHHSLIGHHGHARGARAILSGVECEQKWRCQDRPLTSHDLI